MTVAVGFTGRFGNNLFQYIAGRLFAEDNGLDFVCPKLPWPESLFTINPHPGGHRCGSPNIVLDDRVDLFDQRWPLAQYSLYGFFQKAAWYYDRRPRILNFIHPSTNPEVNETDLVIHLRLTDYVRWNIAIHPRWHHQILERESFKRLHLVVDEPNDQYLSHFKKWDPIIHSGSPWDDWNTLRGFRKMVVGNSTFSWWAAFFSRGAEKVYVHSRWVKGLIGPKLTEFPNAVAIDGPFIDEESW